MNSKLDAGWRE